MTTNKKGMQSYVDYLIADIQQAEGQESGDSNFINEIELVDHFAEIEKFVTDDPLNTFAQICGLTREQFPPMEKLSKQQVKKIVRAFYSLLHSWNLDVVFPKKFPEADRYEFLVPLLDKKVHILKGGVHYIEFCEYEPKECPFGSWCDCKDFLEERFKTDGKKSKTKSSSK